MNWTQGSFGIIGVSIVLIPLFFFATTKASLAISGWFSLGSSESRHIYWIYRSPLLVWLTDRRFVVSAVLLFQYDRLVDAVLESIDNVSLPKKRVLQVGCVSGDITEKLVLRTLGNAHVSIFDMTEAGVRNSRKKLARADLESGAGFFRGDAASIPVKSGSFDRVFSFFLFHELPTKKKRQVFRECLRVIRPGGVFVYAEFHRPTSWSLRLLGSMIFGIFEPYAREMWRWHPNIDASRFEIERKLFLSGYFQVVSIRKRSNDLK